MSKKNVLKKNTEDQVFQESESKIEEGSGDSPSSSMKNSGNFSKTDFGAIKSDFFASIQKDVLIPITFKERLLVNQTTIKEVMIDLPMPLGTFSSKTFLLNHSTTVALFNSIIKAYDLRFCVLANNSYVLLAAREESQIQNHVAIFGVHHIIDAWFNDLVLMKQKAIQGVQLCSLNGKGLVIAKALEVVK